MNIQIIAEIMGTVAFAISGAMLAIERKMDLFGIVFLGIVTAAGGGFIRDMTLGIVPPAMFSSPMVLPLAILSSLTVCALVALPSSVSAVSGISVWQLISLRLSNST